MNSNGMDIVLTETTLSYHVIGGVLDFYFFAGPTPNAVLEQLTSIVGRPMMVPYWSMGLMNSKCARFPSRYWPDGASFMEVRATCRH